MLIMPVLVVAALTVGLGAGTALLAYIVPRWLPEPADPGGKPTYASLVSPRWVWGCAVAAAVAAVCFGPVLDWRLWPAWVVLGSVGVVLVAIDAVTTWLPLSLTRPLWLLTALAVVVTGMLAGWPVAGRMLLAAVAALVFFAAFWWLSRGGIAFGDVRLAPVLGAVAGSVSVTAVLLGLLAGSLIGVAWGLVARAAGRRGAFAYAPALWLGTILAAPLSAAL